MKLYTFESKEEEEEATELSSVKLRAKHFPSQFSRTFHDFYSSSPSFYIMKCQEENSTLEAETN